MMTVHYYFRESDGTEHFTLNPTENPVSTNGHQAVNKVDFEHFGFSLRGAQPTATRTYWLDKLDTGEYVRVNQNPLPVPIPTWSYIPPANPGGQAQVRMEIEVPEPPEVIDQKPDSIWMKIFKTEIEREVELDELMSGPGIVPQDETELEIEWELLEGGKVKQKDRSVNEDGQAVLVRYEYFKYTGPVDDENEPITPYLEDDTLDPVALGHVGDFMVANMVAANLMPPIPVLGDFNADDLVNELDINLMGAAINLLEHNPLFDVNEDDFVNDEDFNQLIHDLLETEYGDFNLDQKVDLEDLAKLATHFGQNVSEWSKGDANHDGVVDLSDLAKLATHFGFNNADNEALPLQASTIPEPSSLIILMLLCAAEGCRGRTQ